LNLALVIPDINKAGNRRINAGKNLTCEELNRFVATPSQLRAIGAPALPQSNLIEVTLFGLISQRT
jgi:hypothetical protein